MSENINREKNMSLNQKICEMEMDEIESLLGESISNCGYSSTRAFINDLNLWNATAKEILEVLEESMGYADCQ